MPLGYGKETYGVDGKRYEQLIVPAGTPAGGLILGPINLPVDIMRRKSALFMIASSEAWTGFVSMIQLEAALTRAPDDPDPTWYMRSGWTIRPVDQKPVNTIRDTFLIGVQIRIKVAVSAELTHPIRIELAHITG